MTTLKKSFELEDLFESDNCQWNFEFLFFTLLVSQKEFSCSIVKSKKQYNKKGGCLMPTLHLKNFDFQL